MRAAALIGALRWLVVAMLLGAGLALPGSATFAQDGLMADQCTGSGGQQCLETCEAALRGYNELFKVRPVPDLAVIRERALVADQCERLVTDQGDVVDDDLQVTIGFILSTYPAERDTASGCAYAITMAETGGYKVGSPEYLEIFDMVGCGAYAEVAENEAANARACTDEQSEFDAVILSVDIDVLRRFEQGALCRDHKAQAYLRIKAIEDGEADTPNITVAAGSVSPEPVGILSVESLPVQAVIATTSTFRSMMMPPDRDPAPPAIAAIE